MKNILIVILFIVEANFSFAQKDTLHIHYHKNGKVSTISTLEENRFGKARAFDSKGELIYEKEIRRFAGHASVNFTHHKNGSVKSANYSSHPDGGIQWYKTYTTFSEAGKIIKEIEDSHDNSPIKMIRQLPPQEPEKRPKDPYPNVITPQTKPPNKENPKKEIVQCASMHQNFVKLINHTKYSVEVVLIHLNKDTTFSLKPGEKHSGPTYISAEISSPVKQNINFRYTATKKRKNIIHLVKELHYEQYKTRHTIHLFESSVEKE